MLSVGTPTTTTFCWSLACHPCVDSSPPSGVSEVKVSIVTLQAGQRLSIVHKLHCHACLTAGHSLLTTSIGHICGHSSLLTGNYHTCGHSSLTTSVGQTGAIDCSDVPKKQLKTPKRCMYLPKTHCITVFQSSRTRCTMDKHYTLRLKPQKSVKFQQTCICSHRAQTVNRAKLNKLPVVDLSRHGPHHASNIVLTMSHSGEYQ